MSEHILNICQDFLSDTYTAECSCGWVGRREHDAGEAAADEWENHCDAVFMESTYKENQP